MAPNIDHEADHIRDKAKKDLLGILEGVSSTSATAQGQAVLTATGQRQEEPCPEQDADWATDVVRGVWRTQRLWS